MQNHINHNENLWRQYLTGKASKEELEALFRLNEQAGDDQQNLMLEKVLSELPATGDLDADRKEEMLQSILENINQENEHLIRPVPSLVHLLKRWIAAAAVLFLLSAGAYWFLAGKKKDTIQVTDSKDVQPGQNGALLTLADGTQILLDTIQNATIALQDGVNAKVVNGALVYEQGKGKVAAYNTVATPKGRQYQVTLSDQTKVWLNAASSIRYPAVFSGRERVVEVSGEAYFEVAKNRELPFKVKIAKRAEVEVLGTDFNVNAYNNEELVNTTLVNGAVRVYSSSANVLLKPGQQAQVPVTGSIRLIDTADMEKVMAWKNGLFNFEGASLKEVMRQLERWYEIEVVYEGKIPDVKFGGMLSKGLTLNQLLDLLKTLEGNDLKFSLEKGRTLVVRQAGHP